MSYRANDQVMSDDDLDLGLRTSSPTQMQAEPVFKMPLFLQQGCVCKSEPGTSLFSVPVLTHPAELSVELLYIFHSSFCTAADLHILTS